MSFWQYILSVILDSKVTKKNNNNIKDDVTTDREKKKKKKRTRIYITGVQTPGRE